MEAFSGGYTRNRRINDVLAKTAVDTALRMCPTQSVDMNWVQRLQPVCGVIVAPFSSSLIYSLKLFSTAVGVPARESEVPKGSAGNCALASGVENQGDYDSSLGEFLNQMETLRANGPNVRNAPESSRTAAPACASE
jgi:hypothetical protein